MTVIERQPWGGLGARDLILRAASRDVHDETILFTFLFFTGGVSRHRLRPD